MQKARTNTQAVESACVRQCLRCIEKPQETILTYRPDLLYCGCVDYFPTSAK